LLLPTLASVDADPEAVEALGRKAAATEGMKESAQGVVESMEMAPSAIRGEAGKRLGEMYKSTRGGMGRGAGISGATIGALSEAQTQAGVDIASKEAELRTDIAAQKYETQALLRDLESADIREEQEKWSGLIADLQAYWHSGEGADGSSRKQLAYMQRQQRVYAEAGDQEAVDWLQGEIEHLTWAGAPRQFGGAGKTTGGYDFAQGETTADDWYIISNAWTGEDDDDDDGI
jgi:hypothetical protein